MIYFASDVHLGAGTPEEARQTERRFLAWLDKVSRDADAVFLLGDLFDFWFEYRRLVPKASVRVLGKLAELTDRGIRVVFFAGNHDLWVRDFFEKECGMEVYATPQRMVLAGKRVLLAHGDCVRPRSPGLRLRAAMFRSKVLRWLFSWSVHPELALRFGRWWSDTSRRKHARETMGDHLTEPLIEYAREQSGVDLFIFGHTHWPRDCSEGGFRVICLGDWIDRPAYAAMNEQAEITLCNNI